MIHSEEFHGLIKKILLLSVIIFICCLLFSQGTKKVYEKCLMDQDAKILATLIQNHSELETEIVNELKKPTGDVQIGHDILKKYGITESTFHELDSSRISKISFYASFVITFSVLIVITILYLFHLRKIYKKLDFINQYINDVLNDHYSLNLKEYKEGAFSTLKNDIYKITNKLRDQKELLESEKKYLETTLSDISHQLKTPLTSMYVINNLLEDDKLEPSLKKEFLHKNAKQLERIEWLVSSLLKLSRLENGMIQLKKEKVKIVDLINQAKEPIAIPMELKNQKFLQEGKKSTTIICDKNWTTESIVNIIKNAHEHTKEEDTIKVSWNENPLYVELLIEDNGEGIEEQDIRHIFERFYKGSHNTKESIGIGLNMSKQILIKQNATIEVKSKKGVGTTFIIRFFKNNV